MKPARNLLVSLSTAALLAAVLHRSGANPGLPGAVSIFLAAGLTGWVSETYSRRESRLLPAPGARQQKQPVVCPALRPALCGC